MPTPRCLRRRRNGSAGSPRSGWASREILRRSTERELADIFFRFGEERFSRRIARAIVERRRKEPVERTAQLADLVKSAIPRKAWPRSIHPATRVFQALRIAVNRELESLAAFLDRFASHLAPGGRVAVISFHSLEDRMVKVAFPTVPRRRGIVGLAVLVLAVALFSVWLSGMYYRIGYAVSLALEEKQALQKEQALLKTEIMTLRSPARIEAIARGQLGMGDPKTERIIRVK